MRKLVNIRLLLMPLALLAGIVSALAQESGSFDDFRKGILDGYQDFRKGVLDDYASFLDGVWKDYEASRPVKRDPVPKPDEQPVAPAQPPAPVDVTPKPDVAPPPGPAPEPASPVTPPAPPVMMPMVDVAYKDIKARLPKIAPARLGALSPQSLSKAWRETVATEGIDKALAAFDTEASRMRLPDWWAMNLAIKYGDAISPDDHNAALVLAAVIMVNRGYDIKLAIGDSGLVILFRSDDMIYSRMYFKIDDMKYFVIGQDRVERISTYNEPDHMSLRSIRLPITMAPVLPRRMQRFTVTDGHLTITGEVDAAMAERLRDYPQMPIPLYAVSVLQPDLRASVRSQLREQTASMGQWQAANALISLVQHGFEYATDDEQFGFEKPFFMEDLLYWPKCDCEDRSVFYAWIAREVLGVDVHLLGYPGHEATAVALGPGGTGSGYDYEGRRYYIADPTFIGAPVGLCMPQFVNTSPEIQLIR